MIVIIIIIIIVVVVVVVVVVVIIIILLVRLYYISVVSFLALLYQCTRREKMLYFVSLFRHLMQRRNEQVDYHYVPVYFHDQI